jgi:cytoskeletal protein RodZ
MDQKGHIKPDVKETSTSKPEKQEGPRAGSENNEENGSLKRAGVGDLLKNQREKMGLSHTRISEIIKIRPYILDALENENWEVLPSSVFVTGFIRSYARTLGLQEEKIVALYHKHVPADEPSARHLVVSPRYRRAPFVICVFMLLIMASAYYLWKEYPAHEKIKAAPEIIRQGVEKFSNSKDTRNVTQENGPAHSGDQEIPAALPVTSPPGSNLEHSNSTPASGPTPSDMENPEDISIGTEGPLQSATEQMPSRETNSVTVARSDLLILKAIVRERTYVRMVVDSREPKEYVFRAGSTPQWEATECFDVLIGNAGGVDLEFNGKKVESIGRSGQVVRLKFPKALSSQ